MKFVGKNMKTVSVPTLRNWMPTIRGFQYLSEVLNAKGLKSLLPSKLNQDPLENFFGAVGSLGCTNSTCASFIQSYETLMLNNLVSSHSPGANCEEDLTEGTLTNYKHLFCSQQTLTTDLPRPSLPILSDNTEYLRQLTHIYIYQAS
ncbi:unnamed protein product [Macrosiphum euphorbiae]|uniref:Transposable element P transposase-like RNase H C-terminal domain-containing protein n=1 Tax=Macrosiphum euphorbiae TaxID=13131 RepID=A0AAV0Y6M8_9HEMI|nr:unnamed protein product [Macrosiphum euphorbiae]